MKNYLQLYFVPKVKKFAFREYFTISSHHLQSSKNIKLLKMVNPMIHNHKQSLKKQIEKSLFHKIFTLFTLYDSNLQTKKSYSSLIKETLSLGLFSIFISSNSFLGVKMCVEPGRGKKLIFIG